MPRTSAPRLPPQSSTDSGPSDWSAPSSQSGPPPLPYPLTFLLTSTEAAKLHSLASRLGLAEPPPPYSLPPTNPPTPTASYPSTPTASNNGTRGSPFVAAFTAANESKGQVEQEQPRLKIAMQNAFRDDVLPLTSRTAFRSFAIGYAFSTFVQALLPGLLRRKSPREAFRAIISSTSGRIGAALGLFTLFYRIINYLLTYLKLKALSSLPTLAPTSLPNASHRSRIFARLVRLFRGEGVAPFFAALFSSPVLLLLPSQTPSKPGAPTFPRKSLALDLFTKGLHAHYHVLRSRGSRATSWVPKWCDSTLLYAVANGQLLWAFLFEPKTFPESYGNVILSRSSSYIPPRPENLPSTIQWPTKRQVADHVAQLSTPTRTSPAFPSFISPSLSALSPTPYPSSPYKTINPILDYSPAHPAHAQLLCALLHPMEPSCWRNYIEACKKEWLVSARFVGAFMAAFNVLRWRAWLKDPEKQLFGFTMSVAQGATTISGSIATAWALTCFFQHYLPRNFLPRFRYFFNGFFSSIFIFAVPPARRQQLGLYTGRMSLDSTYQILVKRRTIRPFPKGDVILLALGIAMLANLYEDDPSALGKGLRKVLGLLLGNRQVGTSVSRAGFSHANDEEEHSASTSSLRRKSRVAE